jgi:hypothetical protein
MSTGSKIIIGIVLSFILIIGGTISYVLSAKFTGETFEQSVLAQDGSMQNTWGQMDELLKMQGFTVKNYGETFIKSIKANAERYQNDSGGMMKWVQEAKSQMSDTAHLQLMNTIKKAYVKKEARQLSKISVVQEYRTWRKASLKGTIGVALFSFPSEKVKKIEDRIISTKEVKKTWETGEEVTKDPFAS